MLKAFATALLATTLAAGGSVLADDARWLTPTMINARAEFMSPGLNYLTFQHIDSMFATRTVAAGVHAAHLSVLLEHHPQELGVPLPRFTSRACRSR